MRMNLIKTALLTGSCMIFSACSQNGKDDVAQTVSLGSDSLVICTDSQVNSDVKGWLDFSKLPDASLSTFENYAVSNNMRFAQSPNPIPNALGVAQVDRACGEPIPGGSSGYFIMPIGSGVNPYITYDIYVVGQKVKLVEGFYKDNAQAREWDEKNNSN